MEYPKLTYGGQIWYGTKQSNFNKLQTVQNKSLRIITNTPWFIRNRQLYKEFAIPTVKDFITTQKPAFQAKLPLVAIAIYFKLDSST